MIQKEGRIGWYVGGFRRYRLDNRISRGMVTAAPWVNLALLVVLYILLSAPNVRQPGLLVRLPEAPFTSGSQYGCNVVVLSQEVPGKTTRQEIVYFDDERFPLNQTARVKELGRRFVRVVQDRPHTILVIEADRMVQHGTVVDLFNLAAEAGFKEVNVATLPMR